MKKKQRKKQNHPKNQLWLEVFPFTSRCHCCPISRNVQPPPEIKHDGERESYFTKISESCWVQSCCFGKKTKNQAKERERMCLPTSTGCREGFRQPGASLIPQGQQSGGEGGRLRNVREGAPLQSGQSHSLPSQPPGLSQSRSARKQPEPQDGSEQTLFACTCKAHSRNAQR